VSILQFNVLDPSVRLNCTVIPKSWPDDRYDVIWAFTLTADAAYAFGQVPQLLLSGDADTVISCRGPWPGGRA
jgi:hypothetical protein